MNGKESLTKFKIIIIAFIMILSGVMLYAHAQTYYYKSYSTHSSSSGDLKSLFKGKKKNEAAKEETEVNNKGGDINGARHLLYQVKEVVKIINYLDYYSGSNTLKSSEVYYDVNRSSFNSYCSKLEQLKEVGDSLPFGEYKSNLLADYLKYQNIYDNPSYKDEFYSLKEYVSELEKLDEFLKLHIESNVFPFLSTISSNASFYINGGDVFINKSNIDLDKANDFLSMGYRIGNAALNLLPEQEQENIFTFFREYEILEELINGKKQAAFISDFHKNHVNKVVFSRRPLVIGSETEAISSDFKRGDALYATCYFDAPLKKIFKGPGFVSFNIKTTRIGEFHFSVDEEMKEQTYCTVALIPDKIEDVESRIELIEALSKVSHQPYTIDVIVGFKDNYRSSLEPLLKGSLNFDFRMSESDSDVFKDLLANNEAAKHAEEIDFLPPKPETRNSSLEAKAKSLIKEVKNTSPVRIILLDKTWTDDYDIGSSSTGGNVNYYTMSYGGVKMDFCYIIKEAGKCYVGYNSLFKSHNGSTGYSSEELGGYTYDYNSFYSNMGVKEINCENVNK